MPNMSFHDSVTPLQARVLFHIERLFRSAGGNGCKAHATFLAQAKHEGLPTDVSVYSDRQCRDALLLIELSARMHGMHRFRQVNVG